MRWGGRRGDYEATEASVEARIYMDVNSATRLAQGFNRRAATTRSTSCGWRFNLLPIFRH
jgi:hypothetical protein